MAKNQIPEEKQLTASVGDDKKKYSAQDDLIVLRRERVQSLRARGLTQREIHATISTKFINTPNGPMPNPSYIENPETRAGFDLATVNRDLKWIRAQSLKNTMISFEQQKADQLAEIAELKRALWAEKEYKELVRLIAEEAKIRGTAITKTELSGPDGQPVSLKVDDMTDIFKQMAEYEREKKKANRT